MYLHSLFFYGSVDYRDLHSDPSRRTSGVIVLLHPAAHRKPPVEVGVGGGLAPGAGLWQRGWMPSKACLVSFQCPPPHHHPTPLYHPPPTRSSSNAGLELSLRQREAHSFGAGYANNHHAGRDSALVVKHLEN